MMLVEIHCKSRWILLYHPVGNAVRENVPKHNENWIKKNPYQHNSKRNEKKPFCNFHICYQSLIFYTLAKLFHHCYSYMNMNTIIVFAAQYLYVLPVLLFIAYGIFSKKRKAFWITAFFVLPLSYLLGKFISHFYFDPRPFVSSNVIPLFSHIADNGFPSDHALLTGTLAAIAMPFSLWFALLLWILAILVGGARVLANVHHTIDIVGSFAIALISIGIVHATLLRVRSHNKEKVLTSKPTEK